MFLDIETATEYPEYEQLPEPFKKHWQKKASRLRPMGPFTDTGSPEELYRQKAGIYSEFAKVICISLGIISNEDGSAFRLKSIYGDNESEILMEFAGLLDKYYADTQNSWVCGHNIKEFDIPFLCRRMVVHRIPLPAILQISGKKPWELHYLLDTMDMWKFGDYKHYTSLDLLANILHIPSPKDDIDGSEVGRVYWEAQDLERIARYCEKDVRTVARVFLRLRGLSDLQMIEEEEE